MIRTTFVVASLLAISFSAALSSAALIQTDPNGLAFHGRLTTDAVGVYQVLNTGTEIEGNVYEPPNPGFQGSVMWIAGANVGMDVDIDTNLGDGLQTYAEYTVRFTSQGTYRVHWAGQRTGTPQIVAEGGTTDRNDSVWIGPVDQDHTGTAGWTQLNLAAGGISYRSSNALWVIDGSNVDQNLTFTLGLREDGPIYDKVAFVLEDSGALPGDIHVIPEPTSAALALVALGLAGMWGLRRRS